jgi:Tfp pilus assembly protein PilV
MMAPTDFGRDRQGEQGQGLVEMLIALVMLAIGVGALISVLVAGAIALQRTDQKGTALTLAERQLELYRTFAYSNIRLSASLPASGTIYANAHAQDATIPPATACTGGTWTPLPPCLVVAGVNSEVGCTTGSMACAPVQMTTIKRSGSTTNGGISVGSLSSTSDLFIGMTAQGAGIPAGATIAGITNGTTITLSAAATASGAPALTFNLAPDNRTYEIDTYITYCNSATVGVCGTSSGVPHGAKQVLVVVRDPTRTGAPILARADSIFQTLTSATT